MVHQTPTKPHIKHVPTLNVLKCKMMKCTDPVVLRYQQNSNKKNNKQKQQRRLPSFNIIVLFVINLILSAFQELAYPRDSYEEDRHLWHSSEVSEAVNRWGGLEGTRPSPCRWTTAGNTDRVWQRPWSLPSACPWCHCGFLCKSTSGGNTRHPRNVSGRWTWG